MICSQLDGDLHSTLASCSTSEAFHFQTKRKPRSATTSGGAHRSRWPEPAARCPSRHALCPALRTSLPSLRTVTKNLNSLLCLPFGSCISVYIYTYVYTYVFYCKNLLLEGIFRCVFLLAGSALKLLAGRLCLTAHRQLLGKILEVLRARDVFQAAAQKGVEELMAVAADEHPAVSIVTISRIQKRGLHLR